MEKHLFAQPLKFEFNLSENFFSADEVVKERENLKTPLEHRNLWETLSASWNLSWNPNVKLSSHSNLLNLISQTFSWVNNEQQ